MTLAAGACNDWFTADELAALRLPGVPQTKRKVSLKAVEQGWRAAGADGQLRARQVRVQGGPAWEYHVSALPAAARQELVRRGALDAPQVAPANVHVMPRSEAWAAFERKPASDQAEATRRLALLQAVEAHQACGTGKSRAVDLVAAAFDAKPSTIWNYFKAVAGISPHDRLPALAPDRKGGGREVEIDPDLWDFYRSDFLRAERPTHASCYYRTLRIAAERGLELPSAKTLQRKLERETPAEVIVSCREGREAVRQLVPPQIRTVAHLHALELVNIDGHKWDVFVRWPDGHIARPMMVAIQDIYSRKFLSWRIDESESAVLTRLAFADLFRDYGIPGAVLMDNGRAFASKWISGGAKTRFRFKIKADEPLGLLASLGIQNHWATPYRGQSKPIERGFRDLCDHVAKTPAFAGAYTGNKPDAKPENYGATAIPLDIFEAVIRTEIAAHNARLGRRTETANGRSFDQVFDASYATAPIRKASPQDLRLALLTAERVRADRKTGAVMLAGNTYWTQGMSACAGQLLTLRFDPDDLHSKVFAYDAAGAFLFEVPVWNATGFNDVAAARGRARLEADHRKAVKATVAAERLLDAADIAAALPGMPEQLLSKPSVIRPVRHRGGQAAARVVADDQADPFMDTFGAGIAAIETTDRRLRLVE